LFPPVGLIDFSVGDTDVVVGVVLEGLGFSPPLHPAVSAPMATIAAPPATSASRRAIRPDFIIPVLTFYPRVNLCDVCGRWCIKPQRQYNGTALANCLAIPH
jgi:hypothetical protein